jgi:hypothetical protein
MRVNVDQPRHAASSSSTRLRIDDQTRLVFVMAGLVPVIRLGMQGPGGNTGGAPAMTGM